MRTDIEFPVSIATIALNSAIELEKAHAHHLPYNDVDWGWLEALNTELKQIFQNAGRYPSAQNVGPILKLCRQYGERIETWELQRWDVAKLFLDGWIEKIDACVSGIDRHHATLSSVKQFCLTIHRIWLYENKPQARYAA